MKLGTLKEGGRDGTLVVVSRDLAHAVWATGVAPTLQAALDDWAGTEAPLQGLYDDLNAGRAPGAFDFDPAACASPLPRAYQFVDGSAYLNHVALVRKARGAAMPPEFLDDPLMYQAESDA
ncbi:MAG: FAA hydrolase family protein, partial [Rhodospirillaceae bacterium]|nr:FAA hydrolase family protein [Rhodospirillaceae bacterium]